MRYYLILGILFLFVSCSTDNESTIDLNLLEYVNNFELEAQSRGLNMNINELPISITFGSIAIENVVGQCLTLMDQSHKIIIDPIKWEDMNDIQKEYLMFHELGHCILDRSHNNDKDANDNCISIMQDGTGDCDKRYNLNNRASMLDELFINN